jgi:DNA processing protein
METTPFVSDLARAYLRLRLIQGVGPKTGMQLREACGSIIDLWQMPAAALRSIEGVTPKLAHALADRHAAGQADAIAEQCLSAGITILSPEDDAYPERLRQCSDAPLALFVRGDVQALASRAMLAVVGARRASREGRLIARRWSRYVSERGICVVSGMAYGTDAAAHGGALEGPSPTIAVLGCGLQSLQGDTQRRQMEAIAAQGCVISEYLPEQQARPEHFPQRNRIIAGLADATLVVEADVRSGSLITAGQAGGYGREVLAVPGSVLNGTHAGCHQLIRDGAILVESAEQLLEQLGWQGQKRPEQQFEPASEHEARIHAFLRQEIMHIDALADGCNLTVSELSPILLALELRGIVERLPGSRYTLGG